jgi:hypothetical protein
MTGQPRTTILDTPGQLTLFRLLQIKYALQIEVKTGMTHSRGSVKRLANAELLRAGVIIRPIATKAKCLAIYTGWLEGVAEELVCDGR